MTTRRQWLKLAGLALPAQWALLRAGLASGQIAQGVRRVRGDAEINGAPARPGMTVRAGDVITTPTGGELVIVAGRDAFMIRGSSRVETQGAAGAFVLQGLRILTGAVLSVFSPGEAKRLDTGTATIGVRGSAAYVETELARTYICTCYGEAEIVPVAEPGARETVRTTHHEQPRYVMAAGAPQMIMGAPVVNHTDAELVFLEGLVGRKPPFLAQPGYRPGRY